MDRPHGAFHLQAYAAMEDLPGTGSHVDELQGIGREGEDLTAGLGIHKAISIQIAKIPHPSLNELAVQLGVG